MEASSALRTSAPSWTRCAAWQHFGIGSSKGTVTPRGLGVLPGTHIIDFQDRKLKTFKGVKGQTLTQRLGPVSKQPALAPFAASKVRGEVPREEVVLRDPERQHALRVP